MSAYDYFLPSPVFNLLWRDGVYKVDKPNIDGQPCYTKDQMLSHREEYAVAWCNELIELIASDWDDCLFEDVDIGAEIRRRHEDLNLLKANLFGAKR